MPEITGTVISKKDKLPFPGLKIDAWDKDPNYSDHLGSAIADEYGCFEINYERSAYLDYAEEGKPEIFFLVYQGDQVIHSTEGEPILNEEDVCDVVIEVDLERDPDSELPEHPPKFFIQAKVVNKETGDPVPGMRVEGWDRDYATSEFLGVAYSDADGEFQINYEKEDFKDNRKDYLPDVFFRVFTGDRPIYSSEGTPLKNQGQIKGHVIEVPMPGTNRPPVVLPVNDLKKLTTLSASQLEDLEENDPEALRQIENRILLGIQEDLLDHFKESSAEIVRSIERMSLEPLRNRETKIRTYIQSVFNKVLLETIVRQEAFLALEDWDGPETLADAFPAGVPLRKISGLAEEFSRADLVQVTTKMRLSADREGVLLERKAFLDRIDSNEIETLVEKQVLTPGQGKSFGLQASIYQLSGGQIQFQEALAEAAGKGTEKSVENLAALERGDWIGLLDKAGFDDKIGFSKEDYANYLKQQVELAYPEAVLTARHKDVKQAEVTERDQALADLYDANPKVFEARSFEELNTSGISPSQLDGLKGAFEDMKELADLHPGMDLRRLFDDRELSPEDKALEAGRRVDQIRNFYRINSQSKLLSLDFRPESEEVRELNWDGVGEEDQERVVNNLKTVQRVHRITADIEDTQLLMSKGYHSAYQIAADSESHFIRSSGLSEQSASRYYKGARAFANKAVSNLGIVMDYTKGAFPWLPGFNFSPEVVPYLAEINGFSDLFGNQDYCQCDKCRSILSPVAYFVDLMELVRKHILQVRFTGPDYRHPIDPRVRRDDLWNGLRLTCENTNGLIPYLTIINEILENFIVRHSTSNFAGAFTDREAIEDYVYALLYNQPILNNFKQPFFLPLEAADIYLEHFPITRERIAETVLSYTGDANNVIPQSRLNMSDREYVLISNANTGLAFLRRLYRINFNPALIAPVDVQDFLQRIEVKRGELTQILATAYVTLDGAETPEINGIVSAGSVQVDREDLTGLNLDILDRIHRFVRFWRKVPFSILELDQLLSHLRAAGLVPNPNDLVVNQIADLVNLRNQLRVSPEELCVLFGDLPTESESSLFDQLFNLPAFARVEIWDAAALNLPFRHPAYRDDLPDSAAMAVLHRLLAGLRLDDEQLYRLIEHLGPSLGSLPDGTFTLNLSSLSLFYRHVLVAKSLGLTIDDLFALLRFQTGLASPILANLRVINALIELNGWLKDSRYRVRELAFVLNDPQYPAVAPESAAVIADRLAAGIITEGQMTFAGTVFAYFQGITEAQSEQIIAANPALITTANLHTYRIAAGVVDPAAVALVLPATVTASLDAAAQANVNAKLREIVAVHLVPGAPDIAGHTLLGSEGLTLRQSRTIFATNPAVFEPLVDANSYWLTPAFDAGGVIAIPAGIPLNPADASNYLLQFHVSEVISTVLGQELGIPVERLRTLSLLFGQDFNAPALSTVLTEIVQGTTGPAVLISLIENLRRLKVWFANRTFTNKALSYIQSNTGGNPAIFQIADFTAPVLADIRQTTLFRDFLQVAKGEPDDWATVLEGFYYVGTGRFDPLITETMAIALDTEPGLVRAINQVFDFPRVEPGTVNPSNRVLEAIDKFRRGVKLARFLGVGGEALPLLISNDYAQLTRAVEVMVTAIRTKYETSEEYEEKIGPFEDKIRERKRDALQSYLIHTLEPARFADPTDLYHYFLIDTELEGCARTSRVVAAISSIQSYIQRTILDLERSQDGDVKVSPGDIPAEEWEWKKNYRVWEANRKVFLWPENYLEPDLRDDKTPLFKELENELLQEEIGPQSAQDAYAKYLTGFQELATLSIAGAYHHRAGETDILHLFGVTSDDPPIYYYRTIENLEASQRWGDHAGVIWGPWEKLNMQIPVRKISVAIQYGRLHLFWVEYLTKPEKKVIDGTSLFTGYKHKMSIKFTSMQLDGSWTPPQTLKQPSGWPFVKGEGIISDPLYHKAERTSLKNTYVDPVLDNSIFNYLAFRAELITEELLAGIYKAARNNEFLWGETKYPVKLSNITFKVNFTSGVVRKLFVPYFQTPGIDVSNLHPKEKEGYQLKGYRWNRVYPSPRFGANLSLVGRDFLLRAQVDLFDKEMTPYNRIQSFGIPNIPANRRLTVLNNRVYFGIPIVERVGEDYATAEWAKNEAILILGRTSLGHKDGIVPDDLTLINGRLSDGILRIGQDLLYLSNGYRANTFYQIRRLGTTLAKEMARRLYTSGIDGLLDVGYQTFAVREADYPFDDSFHLHRVNADQHVGKMDTKGSMGVYFREVFFEIPFLIANYLNSQGKYADAQRWYHYIFNPTSDKYPFGVQWIEDDEERRLREMDRVWQYIVFRDHTLATLKEQLNDADAVEAYTKDPFNPHAIARLRTGAYMKTIVMKYIDNLLDWGDKLFARDTMESVNEATLLYVMAAELLGDRPAELGPCQEPEGDGFTYNQLSKKINFTWVGNDFLSEIEHLVAPGISPSATGSNNLFVVPGIQQIAQTASRLVAGGPQIYQALYPLADPDRFEGSLRDRGSLFSRGDDDDDDEDERNVRELRRIDGDKGIQLAGGGILSYEKGLHSSASLGANWSKFKPLLKFPLPTFGTDFFKQAKVFCIPPNKDLLGYWDRVEDRLYKIRNCMNISGVRRQLALFAPEIDPRLLVRARAEGLSIEDVLDNLSGNLPPYRFNFLIIKAKEYAAALQSFGGQLLSAIERKENEELARLRLAQQQNILQLTTRSRDLEIQASEYSLESLEKRKVSAELRRDHYQELLREGMTGLETGQMATKHIGNLLMPAATTLLYLSGALNLIPKILGFSNSTGGEESSSSTETIGNGLRNTADMFLKISDSLGLHANYERRAQGWQFQFDQAVIELENVEQQILAARTRLEISRHSLRVHEQSLEQLQETFDFYEDKFTNLGLYTWMSTYLQRLFRQSYQHAIALARLAERAYRFERNDDTTPLLQGNYWDGGHSGLLAGERLANDLRGMERRFIEENYRTMEVDQAFSLSQIDPAALLTLKNTGECEFIIPEFYFDLFYPGQYRRIIKSARLTIPCVTGPYTNVSATLSLTESRMRKEPATGPDNLQLVPPMRAVTVAASTGQNDAGVFRMDFRDERYMPFEGGGAVESRWRLTLPRNFRTFDYNTINDVVLHISYTAEYDGAFREQIEGDMAMVVGELETHLTDNSLSRMISLRQEFSQAYHRIFNNPLGTPIPFQISERHFPLFLQGRELTVTGAQLVLGIEENELQDAGGGLLPIDPSIDFSGNAPGATNIAAFPIDAGLGAPSAPIPTGAFANLIPADFPVEFSITVNSAGVFEPANIGPGLPVLDDHKLKDIFLVLEYRLA